MVGHQAVAMDQHAVLLGQFRQVRHESLAVLPIPHDRLPPLPAVEYMIERTRIFDTQGSGHPFMVHSRPRPSMPIMNNYDVTPCSVTPCSAHRIIGGCPPGFR
jgi:hypothetical protein